MSKKDKQKKWKIPVFEDDFKTLNIDITEMSNREIVNTVRKKLRLEEIKSTRTGAKSEIIAKLKTAGVKVDDGLKTSQLLKLAAQNLK